MAERSAIPAEALKRYVRAVFEAAGLQGADAQTVAESLVMADLRGVESHGSTRTPLYVDLIRKGLTEPRPQISIEHPAPSVALIDGDNGPGIVVGRAGMAEAIRLAKANGVGVAAVRRSTHYGICAYYAQQAVDAGCIGITVSNAAPTMAVWGSREAAVGTNPIGVGVPAGEATPFVLDMATSTVARGKIVERAKRDETIPLGWAIDRDGNPTESAKAAFDGTVLPFGGAKGSGLAILVDILAGVLSGANYGRHIKSHYNDISEEQGIGHFFLALDVAAFMPAAEFGGRMEDFFGGLKALAPASGFSQVTLPGENSAALAQKREEEGLLLPENVVLDIAGKGAELGVDFAAICGADALPGKA